jgi:hypothetical protein
MGLALTGMGTFLALSGSRAIRKLGVRVKFTGNARLADMAVDTDRLSPVLGSFARMTRHSEKRRP